MALERDRGSTKEFYDGAHRFEHWYRDNSIYFITSSCRDHARCFASEEAKAIFWDRLTHHATLHGFQPWIASLLGTHYHLLGYLRRREELGQFMRKLHGSTAKLVNDLLPRRHLPFWREKGGRDYFDGCLRDESQYHRAYRYTLLQSLRHGIARDPTLYPHTRVTVGLEEGLKVAKQLNAFLPEVPYARYQRPSRKRKRPAH